MNLGHMLVDELLTFDTALIQYLVVFSATGQRSVSLPLFNSTEGLPIGIQIVGRSAERQQSH
ncbi:hypothetical protein EOC93_08040 [Mesorhizobium sp. M6A.T.Ce.TU.002.03.1.1]|nr:hypothetical protein EOC93_08040 [Mesorhizobium sp. M6A.T.Ce.TU.002.03.1.1]